ncbi:MAG: FKBP-type peptidyl-prolyl cis-trans isomerase [Bacteroidales bacterium]
MKHKIITLTALFFSVFINAQQPVELNSKIDSLQYSLGVFVGQWMVNNEFDLNNKDLFNRGMDDLINNQPRLISDSTIVPIITSYQLSIQNERSKQMEQNLFADLKEKSGVGVLPSGVHYIMIKQGKGVKPAVSDTIVMGVVGVFPDGTIFENTAEKGEPVRNAVSNLIPGLSEAIQIMPEGSVWRIFIPSALAYGTAGLPNVIPPNTALVFEISLEQVEKY